MSDTLWSVKKALGLRMNIKSYLWFYQVLIWKQGKLWTWNEMGLLKYPKSEKHCPPRRQLCLFGQYMLVGSRGHSANKVPFCKSESGRLRFWSSDLSPVPKYNLSSSAVWDLGCQNHTCKPHNQVCDTPGIKTTSKPKEKGNKNI